MVIRGCSRKLLIKIESNSIRNKRRPIISSFVVKEMGNIMQAIEPNFDEYPSKIIRA